MLAYATGLIVVTAALHSVLRSHDLRVRIASVLMMAAVTLQIVLGIGTVLSNVNVTIAAGHQSGAVVLLTTVLYWVHCKRTERMPSLS
jgi:heme a synthase